MADQPWWRSAVVYQVYPRSFADSDGDGVGDLEGIPPHGWTGARPWLPFPPEATTRNVATMRRDTDSILYLYRDLLRLRRLSPALQLGGCDGVDAPPEVLAYRRVLDADERLVAINFADHPKELALDRRWTVELSSDGGPLDCPFTGTLEADQAVILHRA